MRKFIIAALAAILAGCGQSQSYADEGERVARVEVQDVVVAVRDAKRGVTCYIYAGALDCIPDSQLQQVAP